MKCLSALCVGALASATLLQGTEARTFTVVEPDEVVCFVESLNANQRLRGSYQVVEGGYLDIDFEVSYAKTKKVVIEHFRQEEGIFDFRVEAEGDYRICLKNKLSTNARKKVQIAIHGGDTDELVEHETEDLAEVGHVDRLKEIVLRLARRVSDLKEQEEYLRRRSDRHHRTAESNMSRVLLSSLCEAAVLLGVNLWQLYYLQRFFEVKRVI
mmetsp:Transcript_717/g.1046  ORF Transcript_717/g.1046 Transcript_717/m.1046 type:complete len:212 (-) Transcript_717:1975-2610(-)